LIKTVLALEHGQLPASLHFQHLNSHIELKSSPFYVNSQLANWPANGSPRRAGVTALASEERTRTWCWEGRCEHAKGSEALSRAACFGKDRNCLGTRIRQFWRPHSGTSELDLADIAIPARLADTPSRTAALWWRGCCGGCPRAPGRRPSPIRLPHRPKQIPGVSSCSQGKALSTSTWGANLRE